MALTATQLRQNVYQILDEVIESGTTQEVVRRGQKVLLVPVGPGRRKLEDLPRRENVYKGTFDELVAISWENSWKPDV